MTTVIEHCTPTAKNDYTHLTMTTEGVTATATCRPFGHWEKAISNQEVHVLSIRIKTDDPVVLFMIRDVMAGKGESFTEIEPGIQYIALGPKFSHYDELNLNILRQTLHLAGYEKHPDAFKYLECTEDAEGLFGEGRESAERRIEENNTWTEKMKAARIAKGYL